MKYLVIILIALAVICILSFIAGAKWLKVRNYYVASDKLNNTSTVTRIVFISDLHESRSIGRGRTVECTNDRSIHGCAVGRNSRCCGGCCRSCSGCDRCGGCCRNRCSCRDNDLAAGELSTAFQTEVHIFSFDLELCQVVF